MVTLPVFGGTVNDTTSPTVLVPNCCTCAGASALLMTGRWQAGGMQYGAGTQASPRYAQHKYPWRQAESVVQVGGHSCAAPTGVHAPVPHAAVGEQAAVQKPPG